MSVQHKELAAGRWAAMPFVEQMANIGSEVERTISWRVKNNAEYSRKAFERSLELFDLTLDSAKGFPRLKEVARLREAVADYFFGVNEAGLTDASLRKYFLQFTFAARRGR